MWRPIRIRHRNRNSASTPQADTPLVTADAIPPLAGVFYGIHGAICEDLRISVIVFGPQKER